MPPWRFLCVACLASLPATFFASKRRAMGGRHPVGSPLEFYSNAIPSTPDGDLVDVMLVKWRGDYERLEDHHGALALRTCARCHCVPLIVLVVLCPPRAGYIQWLFPTRTFSQL